MDYSGRGWGRGGVFDCVGLVEGEPGEGLLCVGQILLSLSKASNIHWGIGTKIPFVLRLCDG